MIQIESPLYDEVGEIFRHRARQDDILFVLESRFGPLPSDLREGVKTVTGDDRLDHLLRMSVVCPDLAAFRTHLK